jgi:DNA modification methylase
LTTQKPIKLLKKLILGYSNTDDLILDPFSGSGSTQIAAFDTGRNAIGYEIDKDYYEEAKKRINKHTAQTKMF